MSDNLKQTLAKIVGPLLISLSILSVFFFGGEAYQRFGLEALNSTTNVLKEVLGVIGFVSLAVLINRVIRYVIFEGFVASATGVPVPKLLSQISSLVIFVIAISACARIVFNQDLTFLWAASGVAGLVVGMALRELLQDVFAGIALNIDRATRIGDYIQIHRSGDERTVGQLMEISWRTTRVQDLMGDMISFPNSKFSAFTISNFSLPEAISARRVLVTLENTVPPDRAMRILQAAALDALTSIVGPQTAVPTVAINIFKPEGVEYTIVFRAEWPQLVPATRAIHNAVLVHLAQAGLRLANQTVSLSERAQESEQDQREAERILNTLTEAPIFRGLSTQELKGLLQYSHRVTWPADRVIVQSGEVGSELFVLIEGLISATSGHKLVSRQAESALLRPGAVFDARVAMLGQPHKRTLRSRTPVLLQEISSTGLHQLFSQSPHVLELVARNLVDHYDVAPAQVDEDPYEMVLRHMRHLFPASSLVQRVA